MPASTSEPTSGPISGPLDVHDLAGDLRGAIAVASRRIRAERGAAALSDPQYSALIWLLQRGPLTPGQLADLERIQPPAMTRTVNCLVDLGLARKGEHPSDKRAVVVSLTDEGRDEALETRRRRLEWLEGRLGSFTDDERVLLAQAATLLRKIASS